MWEWEFPTPAPNGFVGSLPMGLLAVHTMTSFSPCHLPDCSVCHEELQESSPRRTVMISELAGQEISFLPLLDGTRGAVGCWLQARGVWFPWM